MDSLRLVLSTLPTLSCTVLYTIQAAKDLQAAGEKHNEMFAADTDVIRGFSQVLRQSRMWGHSDRLDFLKMVPEARDDSIGK